MNVKDSMDETKNQSLDAVARIIASYAGRSDTTQDDILTLTHKLMPVFGQATLSMSSQVSDTASMDISAPRKIMTPAVPIEQAVSDDKVTCLCCGKSFTMLKRHLKAEHGMTEEEYRAAFGLAEDFPLVAPKYSERKAAYAKQVGLGKYARAADSDVAAPAG